MFSALEVCYENALYKFTFDIDIDIVLSIAYQLASLGRHAQLTRCFSAVAELLVRPRTNLISLLILLLLLNLLDLIGANVFKNA